jgi:hypothetical protein
MFSAAGLLLAAMGGLSLLIATVVLLAASPGLVPTLATYAAAAVPLVAGLYALSRAATAARCAAKRLRSAQISALGDVQAVTGRSTPARRRADALTPERAELLLAEASVARLLNEAGRAAAARRAPAATVGAAPPSSSTTTELGEPANAHARGDTEI